MRNHGRQYAQGADLYRVKITIIVGGCAGGCGGEARVRYLGPYATASAARGQAPTSTATRSVVIETSTPDWQTLETK